MIYIAHIDQVKLSGITYGVIKAKFKRVAIRIGVNLICKLCMFIGLQNWNQHSYLYFDKNN